MEENISKPVKVPFKCPVCNGWGTVKHGELVCQACGGNGYVVVDQNGDNNAQQQEE